jgi:hypothetical protein
MNIEATGFLGRIAQLFTPGAAGSSQRRLPASPWKRWLLVAAVLGVAASTAFSALGQGQTAQKLFFIQRSKNADEAHYDARVNADGALDPKDPVDSYWLNKGTDGGKRASITVFQKIAYGFDTRPVGNGTYTLKLRAFSDRPMWIVPGSGKWRVQTTIAGKQAFMSRIYVATDESGVFPKVLYVDVYGEDMTSGAALTEHIEKK